MTVEGVGRTRAGGGVAFTPGAIWFDLDNTLYDHRRAVRAALGVLYERYGLGRSGYSLEDTLREFFRVNQRLWLKLATGETDVATLRAARFAELWKALGLRPPEDAAALGREYLDVYLQHNYPLPGADETLAVLASRFPLGLLTNGFTDVQRPKIRRLGWEKYFRWVAVAEELGVFKPDVGVFRRVAELTGLCPSEILYVGDSPVEDIIPAAAAGLRTCWVRREGPEVGQWTPAARADLEVGDVRDVAVLFSVSGPSGGR